MASQAVKDIEVAGAQCAADAVSDATNAVINAIEIASAQCNMRQEGGNEGEENSLNNNSEIKVLNIV